MEIDHSERPQSTVKRIASFFRGSSSTSKTLLKWKQSGEQEEWSAKAVDTLIKKLKKQPGDGIKNLEHALKTQSEQSHCVTIPRSIDGRLQVNLNQYKIFCLFLCHCESNHIHNHWYSQIQVSNCKALPHVIYGRVWRWPDLQSHHELKAVKRCKYPFSARKPEICINPYHYERVENNSMLPPILVPRQNEFAPGYSLLPAQQMPEPHQTQYNMNYANNGFGPINGFSTSSCSSGQNSPMSSVSQHSPAVYQQQSFQYSTMNATPSPPFCQQNHTFQQNQPEVEQVHYIEPEYWANVAYYELNHRVGEQFRCNTNSYSLTIDGFTHPSCNTSNRFCLGQLSNVNRNSTVSVTDQFESEDVQNSKQNPHFFLHLFPDRSHSKAYRKRCLRIFRK